MAFPESATAAARPGRHTRAAMLRVRADEARMEAQAVLHRAAEGYGQTCGTERMPRAEFLRALAVVLSVCWYRAIAGWQIGRSSGRPN